MASNDDIKEAEEAGAWKADTKNRLATLEKSVASLQRDRGNVLKAVFFSLIGGFMALIGMAWENIKEFIFK